MPRERIVIEPQKQKSSDLSPEEYAQRALRYGLERIIGQSHAIEKVRALATFRATHGRLPGHILFVGDDGMGKRTLARAFAAEWSSKLVEMEAEPTTKPVDLLGFLTSLQENSTLLISNIGNLRKSIPEFLLPAITEFKVDIVLDKGVYARTINYTLHPFTLIATCRTERDCPSEMSDIFLPPVRLEPYTNAELAQICVQIAENNSISITTAAAAMVADLSRGSPHRTEILLRRLAVAGSTKIDEGVASEMLSVLGVQTTKQGPISNNSEFDALSGIEFERLITGLLERMGFRTEMTKASGDGGVDIVATLNRPIVGGRYIIQCKRYAPNSLVGAALVREFYGALNADRGAIKGILITTSGFTTQAKEFARGLPIELIGRDQLRQLLVQYEAGLADSPPPLFAQ